MPSPDETPAPGEPDDLDDLVHMPVAFRDEYPEAYAEVRGAIRDGTLHLPGAAPTPPAEPSAPGTIQLDVDPVFEHLVVLIDPAWGPEAPPRERRPRDPDSLTFTVEEAGEKLGISRALAYEAVRTGQIPSIHIGRRILVPKAALARLLDASG